MLDWLLFYVWLLRCLNITFYCLTLHYLPLPPLTLLVRLPRSSVTPVTTLVPFVVTVIYVAHVASCLTLVGGYYFGLVILIGWLDYPLYRCLALYVALLLYVLRVWFLPHDVVGYWFCPFTLRTFTQQPLYFTFLVWLVRCLI